MKKILSHLIVLAILLTGYCPSFFNMQHGSIAQAHLVADSTMTTHQSQMDCCDDGMQQITAANFLTTDQKKDNQFYVAAPFISQSTNPLQINRNWRLTGHNSSPPHLNLTGTTIMRE